MAVPYGEDLPAGSGILISVGFSPLKVAADAGEVVTAIAATAAAIAATRRIFAMVVGPFGGFGAGAVCLACCGCAGRPRCCGCSDPGATVGFVGPDLRVWRARQISDRRAPGNPST